MGRRAVSLSRSSNTGRWIVNILLLSTGGGGGNILRSVRALFDRDVAVTQKTDPAHAARLSAAISTCFLDTNEFSRRRPVLALEPFRTIRCTRG